MRPQEEDPSLGSEVGRRGLLKATTVTIVRCLFWITSSLRWCDEDTWVNQMKAM